jgi:hypothetical protein
MITRQREAIADITRHRRGCSPADAGIADRVSRAMSFGDGRGRIADDPK